MSEYTCSFVCFQGGRPLFQTGTPSFPQVYTTTVGNSRKSPIIPALLSHSFALGLVLVRCASLSPTPGIQHRPFLSSQQSLFCTSPSALYILGAYSLLPR